MIIVLVVLGLVGFVLLGICLYLRCSWSRSGEANENENARDSGMSRESTLVRKRQLDFRVKYQTKKAIKNSKVRVDVEEKVMDEEEGKEEDEEGITKRALLGPKVIDAIKHM